MLKPSMAIINKYGERGSPCLTPLDIENSFVGEPLMMPDDLDEFKQPRIHILHLFPNPICARTESKYSQFSESNALSKSILKRRTFFRIRLAHEQISLTTRGPSSIHRPSTYADWTSSIIPPITVFIRVESNLLIILLTSNQAYRTKII